MAEGRTGQRHGGQTGAGADDPDPHQDEGAEDGDVSQFQALTTALAATVGTGNIVGVATAIGVGGPGALFWMWITGLVGMATKYAEALQCLAGISVD